MTDRSNLQPSTTEAAAAFAQSRGVTSPASLPSDTAPEDTGEGTIFHIGPRVYRAVYARPYERESGKPLYRPLRIFTLDPAEPRIEWAVALVNVPYEPLAPGPTGALFKVDNYDGWQKLRYRQVNLEDPEILIRDGRNPSPSDPLFHQQMVYAVSSLVYSAFRSALGRDVVWGFKRQIQNPGEAQLLIRPHGCNDRNAYYDEQLGEISFGYYRAEESVSGRNLPGSFVFTCLSHDIIAHEVTHALVDGLRAHFTNPSGPDVLAFHEAFADLVAVFQHFSYDKVLRSAIRKSRGKIEEATLLTDLARQFGHTTGNHEDQKDAGPSEKPLRTAIDVTDPSQKPPLYQKADTEPHALGSVLTSAVFEAFLTVFRRKTERYIRLATNGSGVLPPGELPSDLQEVLADEASKLAGQFLTMCIRALDYCPPVDLEFGEFLRAVVTSDFDLVPDDPWGYREAWIDAFRRRGIYPRDVSSLSEDALLWRPSARPIGRIPELSFAELRFEGDPCRPAGEKELHRQACALGRTVLQPGLLEQFGLTRPHDPRLGKDTVDLPYVESIRSSRRVGPDGQVVFDLVAEVTQRRTVNDAGGGGSFDYYGGATVILGPRGEIRYVISKRVLNERRLRRQRDFMLSETGRQFWRMEAGRITPQKQLFRLLHN